MYYIVDVYLLLFFYVEWRLSMKLIDLLLERALKMRKLTVLLAFCWVLLVSQILAISSLYNNGLQDIPGTPSVITLVDYQNNELSIESKLEENIEATLKNITHQLNEPEKLTTVQEQPSEPDATSTHDATSTPSEPDQASLDDKINDSGGDDEPNTATEDLPLASGSEVQNLTGESGGSNLTEENPMPVFSEWAQKQMAEAEKKLGENVNASAMKRNAKPTGSKMPALKLRAKNYAAPDCGAKIIASNPEAQSTGSVLTSHKDEYLLNPCTSKIWFVVELCEPIQAERVELANFELFSSSPKDFSVSVSNRFPTRDWSNVGQFAAKDERDVQSFNLHPHLFGKFIRVEIHSHYNSEHYCPVSLFRVYGTSEFEAFETANTPSLGEEGDDDEEIVVPGGTLVKHGQHVEGTGTTDGNVKNPNNILKSAGEAVLSIVKKAAEALGKSNDNSTVSNETGTGSVAVHEAVDPDLSIDASKTTPWVDEIIVLPQSHLQYRLYCFSLAYQPRCVTCSSDLQARLDRTLNCEHNLLTSLLSSQPISASFDESQHLLCANILGFIMDESNRHTSWNINRSALSWLPPDIIAGFCNIRAFERGLILNTVTERPTTQQPIPEQIAPPQTGEPTNKHDEIHEPTLSVIPSTPIEDSTTTLRSPSSTEKDDQIKPTAQEHVNIFNVAEDSANLESPLSSGQAKLEDTLVVSAPSDSMQERYDSASGTLEDIDEQLLLDQQLDGSGGVGGIPTITTSTTTTPMPGSPTAQQKGQPESVFLRLSNRIKALERNMSLSGQYLEELSRRYRKQVEELQHSHAKTLHEIEDQQRRMKESESLLREENDRLRNEFVTFRNSVLSWRNIILGVGGFFLVQLVVVCALVRSCKGGARDPEHRESIDRELAQVGAGGKPIQAKMLRRKSIDGVIGGTAVAVGTLKKKRPSEEALNISGTYENLLIADDGAGDSVRVERKKSRHKHRKISAPSMSLQSGANQNGKSKRAASVEPPAICKVIKTDLIRTDSAPEPRKPTPEFCSTPDENNRIDELPFLEDNDEFIIPTASDLSYNEFVPDSSSEVNKTNGIVSSSSSIDSKSTGKSGKGRRLSSPAFFKASLLRSSMSRKSSGKKNTPSQNVSSASSNTSSSGNSNVRISINVHSSPTGNDSRADDPAPSAAAATPSNGWEWYKIKKSSSQDKFIKRKSKSESPEVETVRNGSAGQTAPEPRDRLKSSISFNGSTGSAEKKLGGHGGGSFRRLFRKVF